MYDNVFFFSVFLFLLVCYFLFLVASFDGLRPVLVTSQCSISSLANKLRSFVRSPLLPPHPLSSESLASTSLSPSPLFV